MRGEVVMQRSLAIQSIDPVPHAVHQNTEEDVVPLAALLTDLEVPLAHQGAETRAFPSQPEIGQYMQTPWPQSLHLQS